MNITLEQIATAITAALGRALDPEEFDVALGVSAATRELDVSTDEWTLHIETTAGDEAPLSATAIGWIAVDDEPEDASRYDSARRAVMPAAVEAALAEADAAVEGALSRALTASDDPFTGAFVAALSERGSQAS